MPSLQKLKLLWQEVQNTGTGICSGEGGMLQDEADVNSRYFYELASASFGFSFDKLEHAQAFHFKGGQGQKW